MCKGSNERRRLDQILGKLESGKKVALVSDAGTPAISDPGYVLVKETINRGIKIEVLP
ncbi:hypothetical protein AGMMS49950_09450 [Endomicrobiia bacterium]|nr:hypothetical protein AGMMS49531_09410 [Endomicrobiia bacterium]GHT71901.1 hypothetical protein AGMMS49950_09450 [Endomicrobiia bacterium]